MPMRRLNLDEPQIPVAVQGFGRVRDCAGVIEVMYSQRRMRKLTKCCWPTLAK